MKKPEPYIARIDQVRGNKETHGWYVRLFQKTENAVSRFFSDGVYGGKNKALTAAREFRDKKTRAAKRGRASGTRAARA